MSSRDSAVDRDLLAQPLGQEVVLHGAQRLRAGALERAEAAEHQQPRGLAAPRQARDQIDGRRVGPLEILEHEQQRALAGEHLEGIGHLPQHARRHRRDGAVAARPGGRIGVERRQLRHPRRRVPRQRVAQRSAARLAGERAQRFQHRQVGLALAVLLEALAARDADVAGGGDLLEEAVEHRRLADPRLAGDEHDRALAGARAHEAGVQLGERRLAARRSPRWRPSPARRGSAAAASSRHR